MPGAVYAPRFSDGAAAALCRRAATPITLHFVFASVSDTRAMLLRPSRGFAFADISAAAHCFATKADIRSSDAAAAAALFLYRLRVKIPR